MFQKKDCFRLGSIARLHGFKGEVSIFLDVDNPSEYNKLESVFVEYDGKLVPFFLEQIQIRNKGFAVVKFETIDNEQKAKLILKCGLYLPLESLPENEGNEFYHFEIEEFKVVDQTHGAIGTVQKVIDLSGNPLIQINFNGKEILLPKQDEFIKEIDWDNKTLHVTAPAGLINMYLGIDEEE